MRKQEGSHSGPETANNVGFDLTVNPDPVGDLLPAGRASLCFEGETTIEYVVIPMDDEEQGLARVVTNVKWQDLRDQPPSKLPTPQSPLYNVWEVTRAIDKPCYLGSRHLGMTYLVKGGKAVLTNAMPLACFGLSDIIDAIFGPPATPPPCPTTTPISGSGRAYSAYFTTRPAAVAAANALVPGRAAVDAGLELNGFDCPNPMCTTKTLGPVVHAITATPSFLAPVVSAFYGQWMYYARADYTWTSSVTCS